MTLTRLCTRCTDEIVNIFESNGCGKDKKMNGICLRNSCAHDHERAKKILTCHLQHCARLRRGSDSKIMVLRQLRVIRAVAQKQSRCVKRAQPSGKLQGAIVRQRGECSKLFQCPFGRAGNALIDMPKLLRSHVQHFISIELIDKFFKLFKQVLRARLEFGCSKIGNHIGLGGAGFGLAMVNPECAPYRSNGTDRLNPRSSFGSPKWANAEHVDCGQCSKNQNNPDNYKSENSGCLFTHISSEQKWKEY